MICNPVAFEQALKIDSYLTEQMFCQNFSTVGLNVLYFMLVPILKITVWQ
jgi:hypothetical protein